MKKLMGLLLSFCAVASFAQKDYKLVWSDEFNADGRLDTCVWNYENGFARNHELQWYQPDNAYCRDGLLVIEARKEKRPNPWYRKGEYGLAHVARLD